MEFYRPRRGTAYPTVAMLPTMTEHQPPASELIGAVIEYLATTVRSALTGHARFEALIAIRLLQTAAAEYELGPAARERERERLEELLGHGGELDALEAELAGRIRSEPIEGEERAALLGALRVSAREELRIANPAYLREG